VGYDTSYHPVDIATIGNRVLPYICGDGSDESLDDLVERMVTRRRVRFRAKSWALGTLQAARERRVDGFEGMLHVWGRPFFIVADEPAQVADDALRYLNTSPAGVDDLAREMIARLDPALAPHVAPDTGGSLPDDATLARSFGVRPRVLRTAVAALRAGRSTMRWGDRDLDPGEILADQMSFMLLTLVSDLVPGWMSRGKSWPTYLLYVAGLPSTGFAPPDDLFGPLLAEFPQLPWHNGDSITGNYMVGGYVPPNEVGAAKANLTTHRDAILRAAAEKMGPADWDLDVRKIDEAFTLAQRLGFGFCEATEIYSGMEGNLN
jgi:hypothetical protein